MKWKPDSDAEGVFPATKRGIAIRGVCQAGLREAGRDGAGSLGPFP